METTNVQSFSPLRRNIGLEPITSNYIMPLYANTPEDLFEMANDKECNKKKLREMCDYLLRIIYSGRYAQWKLSNKY